MHERDMANPLNTATKSRRHCYDLNSEVFDLDSARNDGLTAHTGVAKMGSRSDREARVLNMFHRGSAFDPHGSKQYGARSLLPALRNFDATVYVDDCRAVFTSCLPRLVLHIL